MTPTTKTAGALLLAAALALAAPLPATNLAAVAARQAALRASVFPRIGRAPALIKIDALVEPGERNRRLEIIIDSEGYYRSSTIELDGADAPRLHHVEFRGVPAGTHDVLVTLTTTSGRVGAIVRDRVAILD